MDTNNLKGLMEAYSEVYAPQEVDEATAMTKRGYDEAPIRQKIAKSTGGGEAADRASALEKKSTFGDAKKAKQRQNLARAQRGDFRKTTSSSPGLHGYAHKSDDPKVKAKQAARGAQRGALTPAEKKQFNREGIEIGEAVKGADPEMRKAASAERRGGDKPLSKKAGEANAAHMARKIRFSDKVTKAKGHIPGYAYAEEVDIFDTVLEYLQTKGHENPEQMMTQLSSEQIDAILEATYSAKAARAGKDIGKPGKAFAKIAKSAAKRYGSKERGEKVAGAVLAKLRAKGG